MKKIKALWDSAVKGKRDIGSRPALMTPEGVISVFYYGFGNSGTLFRLHDIPTGEVKWQQDLSGTANRFTMHGTSHFYFPMMQGSGHYYSLDGSLQAEYRVGKANIWAMLPCTGNDNKGGADDVIVNEIHGGASGVERIRLTDGQLQWRAELGEVVKAPVNADGVYYCATAGRIGDKFDFDAPYQFLVYALDEVTGSLLWQQEIDYYPLSSAVYGNQLIVGSRKALVVLDRATGEVLQTLDLSHDSAGIYQMVVADGRLFALSEAGYLSVFNLDNLTLIASETLIDGKGNMAVQGDFIYLQNPNGNVFEHDIDTLTPQREFFVRKAKEASPSMTLTDNYLFVNSKSTFYCFQL